ncbi:hypothetical protein CERSUDRAFT_110787 [Gelatoporia subvermispora B]|uniref:TPX2 C-terminal domain-containing protein n=1 Tax=Ceriporiopsis subvermispora (strain B) TaxID=914234 RepID=M2RTI0_CERS8|nr:hypothetical protein CERSUDRAFT_110787 [Gelatoporia subvermispora B]
MSELSLCHLPDTSDLSELPDTPDASFQIPQAAGSTTWLLEDDGMSFLNSGMVAQSPDPSRQPQTPAHPAYGESTPRYNLRSVKRGQSVLIPRPGLGTPGSVVIEQQLSTALSENLSPFKSSKALRRDDVPALAVKDVASSDDPGVLVEDGQSNSRSLRLRTPRTTTSRRRTTFASSHESAARTTHPRNSTKSGESPTIPVPVAGYAVPADSVDYGNHEPIAHLMTDIAVETERVAAKKEPPSSGQLAEGSAIHATQELQPQENRKSYRKPAVITDGILKKRNAWPSQVRTTQSTTVEPHQHVGESSRVTQGTRPLSKDSSGDNATVTHKQGTAPPAHQTTVNTTRGLAFALMSYGQRVLGHTSGSPEQSGGVDEPAAALVSASVPEIEQQAAPVDATEQRNHPSMPDASLTLSQLPGSKEAAPATAEPAVDDATTTAAMPEPSEPSSGKRLRSPSPESARRRKRARINETVRVPSRPRERRSRVKALQSSRAKNTVRPGADSDLQSRQAAADPLTNSGMASASRSLSAVGVGSSKRGLSGAAPANSNGPSRSGASHSSQRENIPCTGALRRPTPEEQDMRTHKSGLVPAVGKPSASLHPAKPTRPIEFHFQSDARVEARKTDLEKSVSTSTRAKSRATLGIPDFKALHAAQESHLAARKEHIVPVVPKPMEFHTDIRAREREKFEEARREKEKEVERQMEERRRLRELEEEQEIKEMRRRAVPKANEVPEWYAFAPKKAGKT